jgi:rRNA maturation protein Nop10
VSCPSFLTTPVFGDCLAFRITGKVSPDDFCGALAKRFKKGIAEVAPSGWEGTVKHMKRHPEVDNPYALANYMKKKGDKSHHFASGKHKADYPGGKTEGKSDDPKDKKLSQRCSQCGGNGIVANPRNDRWPKICDKCKGSGWNNLKPFKVPKSWSRGLKETPIPTSGGTRNVQKIKKCPTCEGAFDLKIGCPTCGGLGRIPAQDKNQ